MLARLFREQGDIVAGCQADQTNTLGQVLGYFDGARADRTRTAKQDDVFHLSKHKANHRDPERQSRNRKLVGTRSTASVLLRDIGDAVERLSTKKSSRKCKISHDSGAETRR